MDFKVNYIPAMTLETTLVTGVSFLLENPNLTLAGSLLAAALVIIYDIKEGYSFNLPGRGQIGVGAALALFGSSVWFYSKGGLDALMSEIAGGIFGGIFIASIIAFFMSKR